MKEEKWLQPTLNLGIVGHVDHGKTTLTKLLSGVWTDTHSQERKRGITIKLGYTNFTIYKGKEKYSVKKTQKSKIVKKISIVDAPGHELFMATMISGVSVMDYALLLIAADEECPQPQTIEHIKTLEIAGIKKIIVVQNKIDKVTKKQATEQFKDILQFLSTTPYKNSKIIPLSAGYGANLQALLKAIIEELKEIKRDLTTTPYLKIVRSFDVNKPGSNYSELKGGVLGGAVLQGTFKVGDEIEIKPGFLTTKDGRQTSQTIYTKIKSLRSDKQELNKVVPGGSIAISTLLDPYITKSDSLVGQVASVKGKLDSPRSELKFKHFLLKSIITSTRTLKVKPLVPSENLMLIVNSFTTIGIVQKVNLQQAKVRLLRPTITFKNDRVIIFRRFKGNKWRIIGHGQILDN